MVCLAGYDCYRYCSFHWLGEACKALAEAVRKDPQVGWAARSLAVDCNPVVGCSRLGRIPRTDRCSSVVDQSFAADSCPAVGTRPADCSADTHLGYFRFVGCKFVVDSSVAGCSGFAAGNSVVG